VSSIPKRFWVLLAASVAINLFCVGLMVGRLTPWRSKPPHGGDGGDEIGPRGFLRHSGLREAGPEVKQILKQHRDEVKASMRALGQARDGVRGALEAEPYDPQAASRAFARTRELTNQMQVDMHDALLDVSNKLTHEQRKRMGDSLWGRRGKRGD
jgi:Spy/CpxP family protein refolding chaperone